MSVLNDSVVIVSNHHDAENMDTLNGQLRDRFDQAYYRHDNTLAGGSKVASAFVYQACFNYVSPGDIMSLANVIDWWIPRDVLFWFDGEYTDHSIYWSPSEA